MLSKTHDIFEGLIFMRWGTHMHASETAYQLIKHFESLRLRSYRDTGGIWTVGWGSTRNVSSKTIIDLNEATIRLLDDIEEAEKSLVRLVKIPLLQNQFDALVSWIFNLGEDKIKNSTLLRKLNAKQPGVGEQFPRWKYGLVDGKSVVLPGLLRRRNAERELFETGALIFE